MGSLALTFWNEDQKEEEKPYTVCSLSLSLCLPCSFIWDVSHLSITSVDFAHIVSHDQLAISGGLELTIFGVLFQTQVFPPERLWETETHSTTDCNSSQSQRSAPSVRLALASALHSPLRVQSFLAPKKLTGTQLVLQGCSSLWWQLVPISLTLQRDGETNMRKVWVLQPPNRPIIVGRKKTEWWWWGLSDKFISETLTGKETTDISLIWLYCFIYRWFIT